MVDAEPTHRSVVYEFPNPWVGTNYGRTARDHGTADFDSVDRKSWDEAADERSGSGVECGGLFEKESAAGSRGREEGGVDGDEQCFCGDRSRHRSRGQGRG